LRYLQGINRLLDLADAESRLMGTLYAIGICFFDAGSGLLSSFELIIWLGLYVFH